MLFLKNINNLFKLILPFFLWKCFKLFTKICAMSFKNHATSKNKLLLPISLNLMFVALPLERLRDYLLLEY